MKKFVERKFILSFIIILILQLALMFYFGFKKEGLFVDEIWSYNFANHYFYPFQGVEGAESKFFNHWLTANDWNKTITVSKGEEFNFNSVFYNLSQDIHPPVFFIILHAICSFFPEQYSKWFGFIPNMLFFAITQIILAFCVNKITKSKIKVLSVCMFYGFSWGAVNSVLLIRQYMLMTLFGALSVYFHISCLDSQKIKSPIIDFLGIYLATIGGVLTHYYFLIFEFFLSGSFFLLYVCRKEIKICKIYFGVMISALVSCVLIFRPMLGHFLGKTTQGWHVQGAFNQLQTSSLLNRLTVFFGYINTDLFGKLGFLIMCLLFLCILLNKCVAITKSDEIGKYKLQVTFEKLQFTPKTITVDLFNFKTCSYAILILTTVCYFLTVAKIAPQFNCTRYIFIIYPLVCWLFIEALFIFLQKSVTQQKIFFIVLSLVVLFGSTMYRVRNISFIDLSYEKVISYSHKNGKDIAFIGITKNKDWFPIIEKVQLLSNIPHSYILEEKDIKKLGIVLKDYSKKHDSILIYRAFNCETNKNRIIEFIKKTTQFKKVEDLGRHVFFLQR